MMQNQDKTLKQLELKNHHLSDEKRIKDKKINEIENEYTTVQKQHQRQRSEDSKKLNSLRSKNNNLEK